MKQGSKLIIFTLLCLLALGTLTVTSAQRKGGSGDKEDGGLKDDKGGKPKVIIAAVAPSNASWAKDITEAELENVMVQLGRFTVLSRSSLDTILQEQKIAQSDLADPSKATAVGKLLTARYAVIGKCTTVEEKEGGGGTKIGGFGVGSKKSEMNVAVKIQLIDVQTGQIVDSQDYTDKVEVKSTSVSGSVAGRSGGTGDQKSIARETTYRDMVKNFASKFASRLSLSIPIEALVVAVKGGEVAIDAGENSAVKPGMVFEVYSEGEPIRNAAGEVLSYDRTRHARIRVTRVEPKLAWAEIVKTFDNNKKADPAPNPDRIKRDYAVRQVKQGEGD